MDSPGRPRASSLALLVILVTPFLWLLATGAQSQEAADLWVFVLGTVGRTRLPGSGPARRPRSNGRSLEALARAVEASGRLPRFHTRRIRQYAVALARALGLRDRGFLDHLRTAALVHDLGKLAVPDAIVNKPGSLNARERATMKAHAELGAQMLDLLGIEGQVIDFVRHHHECWNGAGYPTGLKGSAIPIGARILAVVDCYDALTSDRPYRRRLSGRRALAIIRSRRGSMYDPPVVDAFVKLVPRLTSTAGDARRPGQPC